MPICILPSFPHQFKLSKIGFISVHLNLWTSIFILKIWFKSWYSRFVIPCPLVWKGLGRIVALYGFPPFSSKIEIVRNFKVSKYWFRDGWLLDCVVWRYLTEVENFYQFLLVLVLVKRDGRLTCLDLLRDFIKQYEDLAMLSNHQLVNLLKMSGFW